MFLKNAVLLDDQEYPCYSSTYAVPTSTNFLCRCICGQCGNIFANVCMSRKTHVCVTTN